MTSLPSPALRVDASSPVPPYEQIRAQLATLIASGRLPEGHRLPPVRQLAADLGLAAGTAARAYRELEAAGLVTTRRAAGTRVTAGHTAAPDQLALLAAGFVREAWALGADAETVVRAVHEALGTLHPQGREELRE